MNTLITGLLLSSLRAGDILEIDGIIPLHSKHSLIMFGMDNEDMNDAYIMSMRFDNENMIVRNNQVNGTYGKEERFENLFNKSAANPVIVGERNIFTFEIGEDHMNATINNKPHSTFYFRENWGFVKFISLSNFDQGEFKHFSRKPESVKHLKEYNLNRNKTIPTLHYSIIMPSHNACKEFSKGIFLRAHNHGSAATDIQLCQRDLMDEMKLNLKPHKLIFTIDKDIVFKYPIAEHLMYTQGQEWMFNFALVRTFVGNYVKHQTAPNVKDDN